MLKRSRRGNIKKEAKGRGKRKLHNLQISILHSFKKAEFPKKWTQSSHCPPSLRKRNSKFQPSMFTPHLILSHRVRFMLVRWSLCYGQKPLNTGFLFAQPCKWGMVCCLFWSSGLHYSASIGKQGIGFFFFYQNANIWSFTVHLRKTWEWNVCGFHWRNFS